MMKKHARFIGAFVLLVLVASVYRIIPGRPGGFAPQMAMAVFGGSVFIKNKKWAFLLPIGSLFLSDLLYQAFYKMGLSATPGFYQGQLLNYIIFASITFFGFLLKKRQVLQIIGVSVLAATYFFLVSNFSVWATSDFYAHTAAGLKTCYVMGLPFYGNSIIATLVFSGILFGGYYWRENRDRQVARA